MTDARCEPPEGLRDRDGWHWVRHPGHYHPSHPATPFFMAVQWWDARHDNCWSHPYLGKMVSVPEVTAEGWTYLMPVPSPADLTALVLAGREFEPIVTRMLDRMPLPPETTRQEFRHMSIGYRVAWERVERLIAALAPFSHIPELSP